MDYLTPPPENPCGLSPRLSFQWACLAAAKGPVLNVGCADDPACFNGKVTHFDCDDWGAHYSALSDKTGKVVPFIQGDAHDLQCYIGPSEYDTIIMGDIVEHLDDPYRAITQAAQICRALCLTVWEEWRLPGFGKNIEAGQDAANEEAQALGYGGYVEHQAALHPTLGQFPEDELPHLCHIWQFSDAMIVSLVNRVATENGMTVVSFCKMEETLHGDHPAHNWLVYLVKE